MLDAPPQLEKSNAYLRFIKTPAIVSFFVATFTWLVFMSLWAMILPGFVGGVVWSFTLIPSWFGFIMVREFFKRYLARQRLWKWANGKFETWEQLNRWIAKTPPQELDRLAYLDSDWTPDISGGAVK